MELPQGSIEQPITIPIAKIVQETPQVRTFFFNKEFNSQPGQFMIMWIPRVDEKPFSIAYDNGGQLGLSIAKVGPFTEKLFEFKEGDTVGLRGPYGNPFTLEKNQKRILLVGGGYGTAPLAILAQDALDQNIEVDFCRGSRTKEALLFTERLQKMNVVMHDATDDGTAGYKGSVVDMAIDLMEKNSYDTVYLCGPELMEKKLTDASNEKNISCQVSIERYMKCGFGICGQCSIDGSGERMCMEGPVVSGTYAKGLKEFGNYHRGKSGMIEHFHDNRT